jgi:TPP-dependent pyruvate/acetoin dehydrogenase alpha subunit
VTFRWYGHVDWREDVDVGVDRSTEDLANWRARDPVSRLTTALEQESLWSVPRQSALADELSRVIAGAWEQAMTDPWPTADVLLGSVYSSGADR